MLMGLLTSPLYERLAERGSWENGLARGLLLGGLFLLFNVVDIGLHPLVAAILVNALVYTLFVPFTGIFKRYPIGSSVVWAFGLTCIVWIASWNDPVASMRLYTVVALSYILLYLSERALPAGEEIELLPPDTPEQARNKLFRQLAFALLNEIVIAIGSPGIWVAFVGLWWVALHRWIARGLERI